MMHYLKNILLIVLAISLPFAAVNAQHKKKKKPVKKTAKAPAKPVHHTTAHKNADIKKPAETIPQKKQVLELTPNKEEQKVVTLIPKDTSANAADTATPTTEVVITSSFKPSLRNASKVNFTAATPYIDTTKLTLTYHIPSQNLFFSYQPIPIKPLALASDSGFVWSHHQYIKAGYGNYSSPLIEAGASFGNGTKKMITAHGKYESAKGNLPLQQYSKAGIDLLGIFTTKKNQEITSKLYWDNNSVYKYGFTPKTLKLNEDSLHQQYNTIGAEVGIENKVPTSYGIIYHPQLLFNYFGNSSSSAQETNLILKAPISKSLGKFFNLDLGATINITHFSADTLPNQQVAINNNLFNFNTSLRFTTPNFKANIGLLPSWDNGLFNLLPNFTAEGKLMNKKLVIEAGWIGYYQKNTYKSLSTINNYLAPPTSLFNTKTIEEYIGIKGSIDNHLTCNARLSFLQISNASLFVNDTTSGKTQDFLLLNEPSIQALRLKGEISYAVQERLAILGGITYTQFTKMSVNNKAYGLIPLEINGSMRWKILNDLTLHSNLFIFDAGYYRNVSATHKFGSSKLNPAFDANVSAEFPVMKRLNAWVQFNNLFNNRYQRWNQYEVLGFQLLAGVVYSFR